MELACSSVTSMRASVFIATSLDGYIARPDGDVGWLDRYNSDPTQDHGFSDFFASVDCLLMGRKTFEKVLSFGVDWPYAGKHVVVLSHGSIEIPEHLQDVESASGAPDQILGKLSDMGCQHAYVDGGMTIRQFLAAGLIDSLNVTRVPLLLGDGIPLFSGLSVEIELEHVSTRSMPSGLVQSQYRVVRDGAEEG